MSVSAIILAAGEGTRMRSSRPKPLHLICGRAMVLHVIHALEDVSPERTAVVVGEAMASSAGQRPMPRARMPARVAAAVKA